MLNPEKYNEKIAKIENGLKRNEEKKEEHAKALKKAQKGTKKCLIGLLALVVLFGITALVIFYEPAREIFFNLLKIDTQNFSSDTDVIKLFGAVIAFIVIEVIIVALSTDGSTALSMVGISLMFAGVLFLFSGFYMLFSDLFYHLGCKNSAKKQLKPLEEVDKKLQKEIEEVRKQQEEEQKKLVETDEMFRRGQEENNWDLIQKAAKLGNPKAVLAEGKRLYEKAGKKEPDRALLQEAAGLGYPDAIFDLAELWLDEANSDLMTKTEKSAVLKKVDSFVKEADFSGHPDGRMLQISRLVYSTDKKDYHKLLQEVRALKNANILSDKYKSFADIMIKQLVSQIDRMEV